MPDQLSYIKRYRMERSLTEPLPCPFLPPGFRWLAWEDPLLERHAEVHHQCFRDELDVQIFPSFASISGCRGVLETIRKRDGFCPGATWLIGSGEEVVGTVQGLSDAPRVGAIQNLGVLPEYRKRGLGIALLRQALIGFQQSGLTRVYLEVTAKNFTAIQLYRSHGFRCTRTIYKPILVTESAHAGSGI